LRCLEDRIRARGQAGILGAEGAGQELMKKENDAQKTDASGNIRLHDIGLFLKNAIERHFRENHLEINLKYIEPSYMIRSVPANASDSITAVRGSILVHAPWAERRT
jgi:6-phosphofructokinase 1